MSPIFHHIKVISVTDSILWVFSIVNYRFCFGSTIATIAFLLAFGSFVG
jgi:hypothetical protein